MNIHKIAQRVFLLALIGISLSCNKGSEEIASEETGYVKGRITDTQGKPLKDVQILIDNTIIYNSYLQSTSDANGNYRIKLTNGAWMAYAIMSKTFNGKTYNLYLDPETDSGFGIEGGIRNFQWKLSGSKRGNLTGTYGGSILLNRAIGSTLFDTENIEFTLTPVGKLIDGSTGEVLVLHEDANYPKLADVPIGRYTVTAVYKSAAGDLPLKLRNQYINSGFESSVQIDFEPSSPDGDNIASIEYREN